MPRPHRSPRKVPPTAAETERASTSVGRMAASWKVKRPVKAIREVWIASTSAWVSGTPLSAAPQRLSPLSTCSSITWERRAERRVSGSHWDGTQAIKKKKNLFILCLWQLWPSAYVLMHWVGNFLFYGLSLCLRFIIFLFEPVKGGSFWIFNQASDLTCWSNRRVFVGIAANDL